MKNFLLEEFNSVQIWILGCNLDLKKMSSWKIIQKILLFNKVNYGKWTSNQLIKLRLSHRSSFFTNWIRLKYLGFDIHDFYSLCRGDAVAHSCAEATGQCHLTTGDQPYFTLAPVRVETICQEPMLTIFHDIVTKKETDYMKSKVLQSLQVATVQDIKVKKGDGRKVTNERTQSSGWLWDQVHIWFKKGWFWCIYW